MPRPSFTCSPIDPYHVWNRCHNKENFGLDLNIVWDIFSRHLYFASYAFNLKIHAFVLMSNHYHMLCTSPDSNLSEAIKYIQQMVSSDVNNLNKSINQLWGSRFGRTRIKDVRHFNTAYKYVYRNPVEAGVCQKVEEYLYSSIQIILGNMPHIFPVYDDLIDQINANNELIWLNQKPRDKSRDHVKKALKKRVFALPQVNKKPNPIETLGY